MSVPDPSETMIRKFESRARLDDADRKAIRSLPFVRHTYHPNAYILREGEPPRPHCVLVQTGFAFRQKLTAEGARQIVSFHLRGDFLDLQHLFLNMTDHNVQALTEVDAVCIDRSALQRLVLDRPSVGKAMWVEALVDSSVYREWVTNVGRRDAQTRIAHVLCEFAVRMKSAGLKDGPPFEFPLTQEQLADAVGLTQVHVNRTLRSLAAENIIVPHRRHITLCDWDKAKSVAAFNALYLHLDQIRDATA